MHAGDFFRCRNAVCYLTMHVVTPLVKYRTAIIILLVIVIVYYLEYIAILVLISNNKKVL